MVNAFSQVAQLAAQPLLSRLYVPEQFGLLAQLTVIASILTIFGTLQTHNYLVLVKEEEELRWMVCVGVGLTNFVCVLALPILLVLAPLIYGSQSRAELAGITCLFVMTGCYGSLVRGINTALGDFRGLMQYAIVRSIALIGAQALLGLAGVADGLMYGLLLGEVAALAVGGRKLFSAVKGISLPQVILGIRELFRTRADFVVAGSLQELVAVAVFMLPLYLIGRVYGNTAGGQFAMAHKMGWAPVALLSQAIAPVFTKYAASQVSVALNQSPYLNLRVSAVLFLVLSGLSLVFIRPLFVMVFGGNWDTAAEICGWVGVFSASFLCALPYRICYRVLNQQSMQLYVDSIALVCLIVLFVALDFLALIVMVKLVVLVGVMQNLALSVIARRLVAAN